MRGKYERELKGIFVGDEDTIEKVTKTTPERVTTIYHRCISEPFDVVRGAGSLGIDLTLMRGFFYTNVEVKSGSGSTKYFGTREQEQLETFIERIKLTKTPIIFAYREKGVRGEKWRVYRPEYADGMAIFPCYDDIPILERTTAGNPIIRSENGMPLSEFISKVLGDIDE